MALPTASTENRKSSSHKNHLGITTRGHNESYLPPVLLFFLCVETSQEDLGTLPPSAKLLEMLVTGRLATSFAPLLAMSFIGLLAAAVTVCNSLPTTALEVALLLLWLSDVMSACIVCVVAGVLVAAAWALVTIADALKLLVLVFWGVGVLYLANVLF